MSYTSNQNQNSNYANNSLSPNGRIGVDSSQKKKPKLTRKKKEDNPLTKSMQIIKPPINKNLHHTLMQTSLNLKSSEFRTLLNDSKESS